MELTLSVLDQGCLPISQLSAANSFRLDDYFLVSRVSADDQLTDSEIDRILAEEYGITTDDPDIDIARAAMRYVMDIGWRVKYMELSSRVYSDVSAQFGFQNMAFKEDYEYSRANHSHNYSLVDVFPRLMFEQVQAQYPEGSRPESGQRYTIDEYMGSISVDSGNGVVVHDMYIPHVTFGQGKDPDIGEVRFLLRGALPTASTANPKLYDEANGILYDCECGGYWAYPRGQTITCTASEYKAACKVYGPNKKESDTSFTMPVLSDFIMPCHQSNALKRVTYQNGLMEHTHTIDPNTVTSPSTRLSASISLSTTYAGGSTGVHSGKTGNTQWMLNMVSCEVKITDLSSSGTQTSYSGTDDDVETYPKHLNPVTIVYIGRK